LYGQSNACWFVSVCKSGYLGFVKLALSSILFDLPFSDKKSLAESDISPESATPLA
jgi:hypothetical protein